MIKKRWRRFTCLAAGMLAALLLPSPGAAQAQDSQGRVLRVAFPELEGISQTDGYGVRTGLVVDYLNEIAKYTGWQYEYIPADNEEVVTNFLQGEYDLMGGAYYSPGFEEYFAYPDFSTGRSRAVLLCRREDQRLKSHDLSTINGKTIGVYEKAGDKIRYLEEFLKANDLDCRLEYYTYDDMVNGNLYPKLRTGQVDMLLGNDMEIGGEFRMVTSFQAQPYYIVTNVGNTEVLDQLNMALSHILESRPNFSEETYYSNFPDLKMMDIQLNDRELRYVREKGTVTVAVPSDWHPFYCVDSPLELHQGILPQMLEKISAFTGLEFTYVHGENYEECLNMVRQGKADIVGTYLDKQEQAFTQNLVLSQPYINLNNIVLKHKSVSYPGPGLTCGVMTGRALPPSLEAAGSRTFDTVPQLLEAVNSGEVDYVYGVSAIMEQEIQRHRYPNVVPVTRENDNTDACFALASPVTPELLTVLNKAIGNISTEERADILNGNLVSAGYNGLSLRELIYANPVASILVLSGALLLIMSVILLVVRGRMRNALMKSRLEAAEAKSLAKSGFLSQMSHEIRTPMNAIVGLTDLTCMEQEAPPEIKAKLKKIHGSAQYLLALINDILDMSRIENGKMEIERKGFSLNLMLGQLEEMMSVQAEQKGLRFQADYKLHHDWLEGDPVRLRQVLTNLLSNAVKFTPAQGAVTLRVHEISCHEGAARYRFSVEDTGEGIRPEDQERIFASFEQLKQSTSQSAGTGLGLPISRNIARLMGGDLNVTSEPGKGSEFYMTLEFPLGADAPPPEPDLEQKSLEGLKVLLAEDNDLNAEIVQELLTAQGVGVCRCANGQEAVDRFKAGGPWEFRAILMDIQMPVKNGLEAAREIRASGRSDALVPIIAMTANTFKEDEEAAREAGMNDFVPKPFNPDRLFSILGRFWEP